MKNLIQQWDTSLTFSVTIKVILSKAKNPKVKWNTSASLSVKLKAAHGQCDKVAFKGAKYYTKCKGHSFIIFAPLRSGGYDYAFGNGFFDAKGNPAGLRTVGWFAVRPALQLLLLKAKSIILNCIGLSF